MMGSIPGFALWPRGLKLRTSQYCYQVGEKLSHLRWVVGPSNLLEAEAVPDIGLVLDYEEC
jgi:hypothetical protein